MQRYHHYIRPCSGGRWPQRILCVDCVGLPSSIPGNAQIHTEYLSSWHCQVLQRDQQSYVITHEFAGQSVLSWWDTLAESIYNHGQTWIISYRCGRIWSLLQFWEQLENGTIQISERSRRGESVAACAVLSVRRDSNDPLGSVSAGSVSRLLGRELGCLICGEPPCIAKFTMVGESRQATWVDSENYGVSVPELVRPGPDTTRYLARLVSRLADTAVEFKLGSLKTTAAAQAMHTWKHAYYKGGVYVHGNVEATEIESAGYYGGRCECFRIGACDEVVYHLDYRSLYPSVCSNSQLPVRMGGFIDSPSASKAIENTRAGRCIATVTVETSEAAYPYRRINPTSAVRSSKEATRPNLYGGVYTDIIYPIGRFTTTLAGPELLDALDHGRIVKWHRLVWYEMDYCLRDYANAMYNLRETAERSGDAGLCAISKRLLVSLPGKLGQKRRKWTHCGYLSGAPMYGEWIASHEQGCPCRYRSISGQCYRECELGWDSDSCPSIAAWITSAGRMRLLQALRIAGWENVIYCDTDSVVCNHTGYTNLVQSGLVCAATLGYLQVKTARTQFAAYGIKHYIENGRLTCAGLPLQFRQVEGGNGRYEIRSTVINQIRRGDRPKAGSMLYQYGRQEAYRHGIVCQDGRVKPIIIREG